MSIGKIIEKFFLILSFLYFSEAFFQFLGMEYIFTLFPDLPFSINFEINNLRILFNLLIFSGNIVLIFIYRQQVIPLVTREKLLWILMAIALISVFWSVAPSLSLRRFVVLLNATLSGIYFAARYTIKKQINLLFWMLTTTAIISLIFIVLFPDLGIMSEETPHPGAWQGIYAHKNILGRVMALGAFVSFIRLKMKPSYPFSVFAFISLSLAILLIIGSTSQASLSIVLFLGMAIALYQLCQWSYRSHPPIFIGAVFITVGLGILLLFNFETILAFMGRDLTLTGRTKLWDAIFDKIWVRPWLGYGYGAFWQSTSPEYLDVWKAINNWETPNGHNGFLDLWLELGLVGLSVFILSFLKVSFEMIKQLWKDQSYESLFIIGYLLLLLLANVAESSLLGQRFFWLLYVTTVLSTHKIKKISPNKKIISNIH